MLRHPGPKLPVHVLKPRIASFYPGKDLPDMLAMLLVESPVLSNLVHLSEDNLAQVPYDPSHVGILAPQIIDS